MDKDVVGAGLKTCWEFETELRGAFLKIDIKDLSTTVTKEVAVVVHVGAIAHGGAVENDFPNDPGFNQGIQTIIDGGHRNIGHVFFSPEKNLFSSGMIAPLQEHIINMLALGRWAEAAGGEALIQLLM